MNMTAGRISQRSGKPGDPLAVFSFIAYSRIKNTARAVIHDLQFRFDMTYSESEIAYNHYENRLF
jgi:hypothetical protein